MKLPELNPAQTLLYGAEMPSLTEWADRAQELLALFDDETLPGFSGCIGI